MSTRAITLRNMSPELEESLLERAKQSGQSLNKTVQSLLERALGLGSDAEPNANLEKYFGTLTQAEAEELEAAVSEQRQIEPDAW